jgi:hypothetical protein
MKVFVTGGIGNRLVDPREGGPGEVERRKRLGGLLNYYYRKEA